MGESSGTQPYGPHGMSRWIVRPLLTVPKDRILLTCETYGLLYAHDPTNFQPSLTLRNAIRHHLSQAKTVDMGEDTFEREGMLKGRDVDNRANTDKSEDASKGEDMPSGKDIDNDLACSVEERPDVLKAIQNLQNRSPDIPGRDGLRNAVRLLGERVEMIDTQVNNHLVRACLPSPPSTVILRSQALSLVTEPEVRVALVRRVLRYVSPRLWGSLQAEVCGDRERLDGIVRAVWGTLHAPSARRSKSSGANVLWVPGIVRQNGPFRIRNELSWNQQYAWLVRRAKPIADYKLARIGRANTLNRDVTDILLDGILRQGLCEVMYDARFLVTMDISAMPEDIAASITYKTGRVFILPGQTWLNPRVVWRRTEKPDEELASIGWDLGRWKPVDVASRRSKWIQMRCIRTLEAI